jgi:peptide deformylase
MSVLHIITAPDPRLKEKSSLVSEITPDIKKLMKDMLDTLYADYGVGLAAIQVGVAKQIIVLDLQDDDEEERPEGFYPLYIVNPQKTWASEELNVATEGCLSVPTLRIEVPRPERIKIKYLDFDGKPSELEASGWLARAIQHEMDHLSGTLILDYLSTLKKDIAISKLKKFKKQML